MEEVRFARLHERLQAREPGHLKAHLFDFGKAVIVGGDHVKVFAGEGQFEVLHVGLFQGAAQAVQVQRHEIVDVDEEGEELDAAHVRGVDHLQLLRRCREAPEDL